MRVHKFILLSLILSSLSMFAQQYSLDQAAVNQGSTLQPASVDQVVDRMIQHEQAMVKTLEKYSPVVETYLQYMRPDPELGSVPASDQYFLRRLDLMKDEERSFLGSSGSLLRFLHGLSRAYSMQLNPAGFSYMIFADRDEFDRKHYLFKYVRREFLGGQRCVVFDVQPKKNSGNGRFLGRLWAEDQDYNIVRLNGTYVNPGHSKYYFHFDSWRLNMQAGVWLPAYVYSEENDLQYGIHHHVAFKAQTRLWGYNLKHGSHQSELTDLVVDSPEVKDQSEAEQDATPVQSQRLWEQQAENNVVERLQRAGLLAPAGEIDKVLETVVNNLAITNNLELPWPVHCRVLLTSPLETFHIGRTIVISRGLLDVLPDEASLATVLSHELGHIVLGHQVPSKFAFSDRMLFSDETTYQELGFNHNVQDEQAADKRALELLQNSPYKDKLANAGLFLKALESRVAALQGLVRPHLGNPLAAENRVIRMPELMNKAPQLEMSKRDQVPALPLGGRVKIDPWNDRAELIKSPAVSLVSAREKMLFEVTPVFPHLSRQASGSSDTAQNSPSPQTQPSAAGSLKHEN